MVWQRRRAGNPLWWGMTGAGLLALYGVVAAWQGTCFGKTYAVYGAVFIALSLAGAGCFDGFRPDRFDVLGGLVCFAGIALLLFGLRP